MPFVRRIIKTEGESTFSARKREHRLYVPKRRMLSTDREVPVEEIPDATLQDLAHRFPDEFAEALAARGLEPLEPDEDGDLVDPDDDEDEEKFSERQIQFMQLNRDEAIRKVEEAFASKDAELLAEYAEAEEARERPRKSVLAALAGTPAEG